MVDINPATLPLTGRHVTLRKVTVSDYPFLESLEAEEGNSIWWRYRGETPAPETLSTRLWSGVLAQFLVSTHEGEPAGLVSMYGVDFRNSHAKIAALFSDRWKRRIVAVEALELFVAYIFDVFDLYKLYAESPEPAVEHFASGLRSIFDVEGVLKGHSRFRGTPVDYYVLAIHRSKWPKARPSSLIYSSSREPLSEATVEFARFVDWLRGDLGWPLNDLCDPTVRLDALAIDSLQIWELAAAIEDASGTVLHDQALLALNTLGDLYHFAVARVDGESD